MAVTPGIPQDRPAATLHQPGFRNDQPCPRRQVHRGRFDAYDIDIVFDTRELRETMLI
jgi:hypothetical protein